MSDVQPSPESPIDSMAVPEKLSARVVLPGVHPAIHGYDVDGDLADNYSFGELVLTALTSIAPDATIGRCFEVALSVAAPVSIGEAPSHAAAIVALCGANAAGVASTSAIALSEQARTVLSEHADFIAWMTAGSAGEPPVVARPPDDAVDERVVKLRGLVERRGGQVPLLLLPLTWWAAWLALLYHCGLRQAWQFEAVLCLSRWPVVIAEANAARPGGLRSYPIRTPPFRYVHTGEYGRAGVDP